MALKFFFEDMITLKFFCFRNKLVYSFFKGTRMLVFSLIVAVHNVVEKESFPLLNLSLTLSVSVSP